MIIYFGPFDAVILRYHNYCMYPRTCEDRNNNNVMAEMIAILVHEERYGLYEIAVSIEYI